MKIRPQVFLLTILFFSFASSQHSSPKGPKIERSSAFFPQFVAQKPTERGEFETRDAYQKRISKHPDTTKVLYFMIDALPPLSYKNYVYDVDSLRLSVGGGHCDQYGFHNYEPQAGILTIISTNNELKGTYKASNSFGKSVTVEKTYEHQYLFNFVNSDVIPDSIVDRSICTFFMPINLQPKEAQKLSKTVTLVVGVTVLDYNNSEMQCVLTTEPKIDSPYERSVFSYVIDVRLISLNIYDKSTRKFLATCQPTYQQ